MPRLMKVRRHGGAQRGRSRSSVSETQVNHDFNPYSGSSVRVDDGNALQDLRDRYSSWNPFQSDSSQKSKGSHSSGSSVSGDCEFGKSEDAGFVFGASCSSSASNSVKGGFFGESMGKSLTDEVWKLNIGSGMEFRGAKEAEKGVFVFGSSSKNTSGLDGLGASNLPDEMRKMKIENLGNVDGGENTKGANFSSKVNNKSKNFFVGGNVASAFEGVDTNKLPDELKKMNIEDTINIGGHEKPEDVTFNSKIYDSNFVFGSNKSDISSLGGSSASVLPEEMKKLNIEGSGIGKRVEETKGDSFKVNSKTSFVFGSKKDDGSSSGSTLNMLPDEMKKMNIGSQNGDPGDCPVKAFPSSTMFEKDSQFLKSSDNITHDPSVASSIPTFSFNAANASKSSIVGSAPSVAQNDDGKSTNAFVPTYAFSSMGRNFQSATNVFEVPTVDRFGNRVGTSISSTVDQFGTPHVDFKTPKPDASRSSTGNVFVGLNQKLEFSANKGPVKDTKVKKKRGKIRRPTSVHLSAGQRYVSRDSSQENPESPDHYSPMDFSPYQETLAADQSSRDASVTSDDYFNFDGSNQTHPSIDATDEDLITATESLGINERNLRSGELNEEGSRGHFEKGVDAKCPSEEFVSRGRSESSESKIEDVDLRSDTSVAATDCEAGPSSNIETKENDGKMQFCFASSSEDVTCSSFTFAASTSAPGRISSAKRSQRKKNRLKVGSDSNNCSSNAKMQFGSPGMQFPPLTGSTPHLGTGQNRKGESSFSQSKGEDSVVVDKEIKQGFISTAAAILAAQEACEKWRLRGNQAYANGNLLKAEEYYTHGVNCVSANETSKSCLNALVLCYSNRAAARMSAGRMREALWDCTKAAEIDPTFVKVQVRAANCHLALGEVEDALKYFQNTLPSGVDVCLDRKIVLEASNGLQKAQRVVDYLDRCAELLRQKTSNDVGSALPLITEALSISPYSEKLVEMKAKALLVLRKYDEVIQLCEQSLESAEKNAPSAIADSRLENMENSQSIKNSPARLWRWHLIAKSYFYVGRLEEALTFIEKLEQAESVAQKFGSKTLDSSSIALAATIRELLRHKAAGNEAFLSGRHSEAVDHYTSALACNIESRPFAAICFCNRAAAYQALGQITDAIADCSLAIALDGNYRKAISRRSTLHEMIRDYGQAAVDLQRLVFLLEKQVEDKSDHSGSFGRSSSSSIDLRQVSSRLSTVEEEARKGISLNFYLILGIEPSGTASDVKKAYRKAALRHHPDKAGQFLARNENGDDRLWKEIAEEVHKDADRLFKMIGEAYAVLSDPIKRSQYDSEEIRLMKKKGNDCSTSRTPSDFANFPFERSGSRRQWQDVRKSYRNRSPQW